MNPNGTTVLLALLLVVLNGKAILEYLEWLKFKIKTQYQQRKNGNNNITTGRS